MPTPMSDTNDDEGPAIRPDMTPLDHIGSEADVRELSEQLAPPERQNNEGEGGEGGEGGGNDDEDEDRGTRQDEELDSATTDAEREVIRARRREERLNKKNRGREKVLTLERRLADEKQQRLALENRLRNIEQAQTGSRLVQIQQAEQQAADAEAQLTQAHANAVTAGDGVTATNAMRQLLETQQMRGQLQAARAQLETAVRTPPRKHLDPQLIEHATAFRKKHPWFKDASGAQPQDADSRVMAAIDNSLESEGWDPATAAYWEELDARAKKYLPDRYKNVAPGENGRHNPQRDGARQGGRSPVAGSGSSGSSSQQGAGRTATVRLSPDRVAAMKEAGAWDDPKRKADMIQRYKDMDKRNAEERG